MSGLALTLRAGALALAFLLPVVAASPAHAAGTCQLVSSERLRVLPVALQAPSPEAQVGLTFVGHATFLIESPGGVRIATDYNDYVRPAFTPDIATMNRAHSTHHTDRPDPAIKHVLRGWESEDGARHDVTLDDVRVRNVPTNLRGWSSGPARGGNSIFVFEVGGLCIAHLGHLHHKLTQEHLDELGPVDVVLVPVDGGYTMDQEAMIEVLQAIRAPLIIPMHFFGMSTLERFVSRMRETYDVEMSGTASVLLSRATLPSQPKVLVLPGS